MNNYFVKHKILETEVGLLNGPQKAFEMETTDGTVNAPANGTANGTASGTANFIIKTINNLVLGPWFDP